MSFQDFSLIPADEPQATADDALDASIEGALALQTDIAPAPADAPEPFGKSWDFDWEVGQFRHTGQSPTETQGFDTLAQWCLMAIHTARYAHPVFSDEFGMEEPDDVIGSFPTGAALADWQRELVDALMVHDRVASVDNISLSWDPTTGVLTIETLDVITDEEDTVTIAGVTLQAQST